MYHSVFMNFEDNVYRGMLHRRKPMVGLVPLTSRKPMVGLTSLTSQEIGDRLWVSDDGYVVKCI